MHATSTIFTFPSFPSGMLELEQPSGITGDLGNEKATGIDPEVYLLSLAFNEGCWE